MASKMRPDVGFDTCVPEGSANDITMHAEGVGDRLEVCDTDSLIKESKDSTADWSG